MLILIACIIGQLEVIEQKPITVDRYLEVIEAARQADLDARIRDFETQLPTKKQLASNARLKQKAKQLSTNIAALKEQASRPDVIHPTEIKLEHATVGQLGELRYKDWGIRDGAFELEVLQVIDGRRALCQIDGHTFAVVDVDFKKRVDGTSLKMPGIWLAVGRYSYSNALGVRATVLALSPWEQNEEFNKRLLDIEASREKERQKKPVPPMKKTQQKPSSAQLKN